jgi:hypothetical protein
MSQTLYLIFTAEGFTEAKEAILQDKALLWINPDVLDATQITELAASDIELKILDKWVKPGDDKAALDIIKSIEQNMEKVNILVEYL